MSSTNARHYVALLLGMNITIDPRLHSIVVFSRCPSLEQFDDTTMAQDISDPFPICHPIQHVLKPSAVVAWLNGLGDTLVPPLKLCCRYAAANCK
jgi:hypothetical protein